MALVGDLIKYDVIQSETETETISITYPDNLPLNDPNYDLRGETVDVEVPKNIETEQIYNNVYVVVHSINSWKQKTTYKPKAKNVLKLEAFLKKIEKQDERYRLGNSLRK
jgi:hypothetical protein